MDIREKTHEMLDECDEVTIEAIFRVLQKMSNKETKSPMRILIDYIINLVG